MQLPVFPLESVQESTGGDIDAILGRMGFVKKLGTLSPLMLNWRLLTDSSLQFSKSSTWKDSYIIAHDENARKVATYLAR